MTLRVQLEIAVSQLAKMCRALAAIEASRDVFGEAWYTLFAEGPREEISRLRAEIAKLTAQADTGTT